MLTSDVPQKPADRPTSIAILTAALLAGCGSTSPSDPDGAVDDASMPICTTADGDGGVDCEESQPVVAFTHVTDPIDYPDPPPTSGNHNPCWVAFGEYDHEIADERWVHNLEHGGVVFLYHCPSGCAAEVAELEALIVGKPFALLTPYSLLPEPGFAVVSWGHRLVTDTLDTVAFEAFYDAHVDQGRESITAGPPASCPAP